MVVGSRIRFRRVVNLATRLFDGFFRHKQAAMSRRSGATDRDNAQVDIGRLPSSTCGS